MEKASISSTLIRQAIDNLKLAIKAREINDIAGESRHGLNVQLLLGIALEGVINEIGEKELDSWTWKELEKASTPLKWKVVSSLKKIFEPSKEPLQTIEKLQKIRNRIVHPKLEQTGEETIIISEKNKIMRNVQDNDILPEEPFSVYIGYSRMIEDFNAFDSLNLLKKSLSAIIEIKKLFYKESNLDWSAEIFYNELKEIKVEKNIFN